MYVCMYVFTYVWIIGYLYVCTHSGCVHTVEVSSSRFSTPLGYCASWVLRLLDIAPLGYCASWILRLLDYCASLILCKYNATCKTTNCRTAVFTKSYYRETVGKLETDHQLFLRVAVQCYVVKVLTQCGSTVLCGQGFDWVSSLCRGPCEQFGHSPFRTFGVWFKPCMHTHSIHSAHAYGRYIADHTLYKLYVLFIYLCIVDHTLI